VVGGGGFNREGGDTVPRETELERELGRSLDALGVFRRVAVAVTLGNGNAERLHDVLRAAATAAQRQGGLQSHTFIAVRAEGVDQARFRFRPVVAIDRAQVPNRGPSGLGLGGVLRDAGGRALGTGRRFGQVSGLGARRTATAQYSARECLDRQQRVRDQLPKRRVAELLLTTLEERPESVRGGSGLARGPRGLARGPGGLGSGGPPPVWPAPRSS